MLYRKSKGSVIFIFITSALILRFNSPDLETINTMFDESINAPLFEAKTLEGDTISLSKLKGRIVVLNFWATWCGPCVSEIPSLNHLADKYKDSTVCFIAITDENPYVVKSFFYRKGIKFFYKQVAEGEKILKDYCCLNISWNTGKLKNQTALPIHVIIDSKGRIIFYKKGADENIKQILSGYIDKALLSSSE